MWSYNNAGFALTGRLLEVVTGRSIHDALRELVFAPLGLKRTFTRLTDAMTYRLSLGHRDREGRDRGDSPVPDDVEHHRRRRDHERADMMQYARFHLGDGTRRRRRAVPVAAAPRADAGAAGAARTPPPTRWAWAGTLRTVGGVMTAAHGGTLNGHCLLLQLVPARNLAFAVLTNHQDGWRLVQDVEHGILRALRRRGARAGPGASAIAASTRR